VEVDRAHPLLLPRTRPLLLLASLASLFLSVRGEGILVDASCCLLAPPLAHHFAVYFGTPIETAFMYLISRLSTLSQCLFRERDVLPRNSCSNRFRESGRSFSM
jgi:hypothetical protein